MPRIRITGLPKANVGMQSGFFKPVSGPNLSTPKPIDVAMLPLREQYEDDASYQQALYEYSVDQSPIGAMPKSNIVQNYTEPDIEAPIDQDVILKKQQEQAYRKKYPNAPKELTGTTSKPFTPSGSEAVYEWSNKYATDKGFAKKADKSIKKATKPSLLSRTANTLNIALPFASLATDMVTNTINQKRWDKKMRAEKFNLNPVKWSQDRGDWETNTGIFRPNQLSTPNIGMYAQDGMEVLSSDYSLQSPYIPDTPNPFINMPAITSISTKTIEPNTNNYLNVSLSEDFTDYANKAQKYINKVNPNTDITGEMLAVGAQTAFKKYGKIVPVELALAQLQEEGYLAKGSKPNKPQRTKNPFNVGNTDDGSVVDYSEKGLQPAVNTYFNLIARSYLKNKTPQELLNNFTNYRGERYASGKEYESSLKNLVNKINNTISTDVAKSKPNMKIRIVGTPDENKMNKGGQPKYSGQSDYGLYIGQRNLYSSMPENIYKDASNSVTEEKETPEDPYVLEAEGGETILRPDGTHMNITGNRHSEGGERLKKSQAPEGSFIYSDTAKMKLKGKVLENFGKSANSNKKYTPAELAKQYNVNKYRGIVQDPYADKLSKDTALRMIENYERKLAELALVQEGKKGFPQGIPDVAQKLLNNLQAGAGSQQLAENSESNMESAKYGGGLEKYQDRGQVIYDGKTWRKVNPDFVSDSDYKNVYSGKEGDYYQKSGTTSEKRKPVITPAYRAASPEKRRQMSQAAQAAWERTHQGTPEDRVFVPGRGRAEIVKVPLNIQQGVVDRKLPGLKEPGKLNMSFTEKEKEKEKIPDGDYTPVGNNIPYGWSDIDKLNVAGALFGAPKKYLPWSPQMEVETYRPTFDDWRAKAATRQAATNNMMNAMGTYGSAQGLASNLSFLQGQQGADLIGDIAQTHSRNVDIANNAEGINLQLRNAGREFKMKRAKELYDAGIIAKQQYDNALNSYIKQGVVPSVTSAMKNAAYLYNQNISESPDYYIDPRTYKMMFNSKEAYNRFMNKNQGAYQADDAAVQARAKQVSDLMKTYNIDADTALEIMGIKGSGASKQKQTQTVQYPSNPAKNRVTTYGSNTNTAKYGGSSSIFNGYNYKNPLLGK